MSPPPHPRFRTCRLIAGLMLLVQAAIVFTLVRPATAPRLSPDDADLRINPNTATRAELELLPRIGPKLAAYIIEYRETAASVPAFRCAEDLDRVHRIGSITVERLRPHLSFASPQPDSTP